MIKIPDSFIFLSKFHLGGGLTEKGKTIDLTTGNLWFNIWQLSWSMLLIMILNFFVGFADVYVAGFISPEVQAAVGFIGLLYFFVIIVANAISVGTLVLVSRAIGAGNFARASEIGRQSLLFSFFIAVVLTITGSLFYREIVAVAGFPAEMRGIAHTFLRIFALALGSNYVLIISNSLFRASGDVKKPLFTMFIVSALNILGNFGFVFGVFQLPRLGYPGIALASAISVTAGVVINLVLFSFGRWRSLYTGPWTISRETIRSVVDLGWPAAMLQIAWNAGSIILYNILGRLGTASITALAAIANGMRIEAIVFLPAIALNMSGSVLAGQNLGAGNAERAEALTWRISAVCIAVLSVMAVVIFLGANSVASILAKDAAVLAETARYLRINMVSEPFLALSLSLSGALQGAGDTRGTMWVIIIAMWIIRLPLAYFLALVLGYGAAGVWVAMVASMICQSLLMTLRFRAGKWKEMKLG